MIWTVNSNIHREYNIQNYVLCIILQVVAYSALKLFGTFAFLNFFRQTVPKFWPGRYQTFYFVNFNPKVIVFLVL